MIAGGDWRSSLLPALVVFESMFGNTEAIAKAVADGLTARMAVDIVEVGVAPAVLSDDVELLVVGGPTHAFGMSRPGTRQKAAEQTQELLVSRGHGLREWLATLTPGPVSAAAAAFDTRIYKPRMPGSAARAAEKRLRKLGLVVVARAESFYVVGSSGPLRDGEIERARRWGEGLGSRVTAEGRTRKVF